MADGMLSPDGKHLLEKRPVAETGLRRLLAGATRLELATSGVTGRRSNQLNYAPEENGYIRSLTYLF
jgi:hypothetical protein